MVNSRLAGPINVAHLSTAHVMGAYYRSRERGREGELSYCLDSRGCIIHQTTGGRHGGRCCSVLFLFWWGIRQRGKAALWTNTAILLCALTSGILLRPPCMCRDTLPGGAAAAAGVSGGCSIWLIKSHRTNLRVSTFTSFHQFVNVPFLWDECRLHYSTTRDCGGVDGRGATGLI